MTARELGATIRDFTVLVSFLAAVFIICAAVKGGV